MPGNRTIRFAAIGILAGAFSGLFGVGGGIVMVPLLIMLGFGERRATATSLCAIVIIAAFATGLHGAYGNVQVGDAVLMMIPAVAGVGIGVAAQQRIPERAVSLLFAVLLIVVAAELIIP